MRTMRRREKNVTAVEYAMLNIRWRKPNMTLEELRERGIPCWPDNDGGLWYYQDGKAERVRENDRYHNIE